MTDLNSMSATEALAATGSLLAARGLETTRLILAGGMAGLLAGLLRASRTTGDCDVIWTGDDDGWERIAAAAADVAQQRRLPPTWLNRDCSMHAWCLPLGWRGRCEHVGSFGPLEVLRIARIDLIAMKVIAGPKRPQDIEDLLHIAPTTDEFALVEAHLDRLEAESLGGEDFADVRAVLDALRGAK